MRVPSVSIVSAFLLLAGGAVAGYHGRPGSSQAVDASILASTGTPVGKEIVYDDITIYISKPDKRNPRTKARADTAVLILTDVFGLALPENKLLADSFARAGYLTLAPDLFSGDPAPGDINVPGFNVTEFLARHSPEVTDPIIETAIYYARTKLGVKRIFAPGYCFGGRYVFRFSDISRCKKGQGVDVIYAAHPSLLEKDEIAAVGAPVSIAAAEHDELLTAEQRWQLESVLLEVGSQPYQVVLYSGTQHGFAVRADLTDPEQRFGKEEAFLQAVRWFDHFLTLG